jgi:hypothetical protein
MKKLFSIYVTIYLFCLPISGQNSQFRAIHDSVWLRKTVAYLSSSRLEGREVGTRGASLASGYVAKMMKRAGLEPYGDRSSSKRKADIHRRNWFQSFRIIRCPLTTNDTLPAADSTERYAHIYEDGDYYLSGDTIIDIQKVKVDTLAARNVLGIIRGTDTTRTIVIGAHYDHLGIHKGIIFEGADDNASGVSGMLALAKTWSERKEKPPINILFAAWTAEEKGELGSRYYVLKSGVNLMKIVTCINMDMISRSAPEDSTHRQLSIGTKPSGENLRKMATEINQSQKVKFDLDLWDVTGHSGSDYKYFSEKNIPVMTFFSGFNADYHTPGDIASRIDLIKMKNILNLVNECIKRILSEAGEN